MEQPNFTLMGPTLFLWRVWEDIWPWMLSELNRVEGGQVLKQNSTKRTMVTICNLFIFFKNI